MSMLIHHTVCPVQDSMRDIITLLRGNNSADQCEPIVAVMRKWAKNNGVKL